MSDIGSPSNVLRLLVGGADSVQEGPEVVRRHAEWERQIESLDKKEVELHQCQLRLIREQHATFLREFKALRVEVETWKHSQEELREGLGLSQGRFTESLQAHATIGDRVKYLEKLAGDSADKHNKHARDLEDLACLRTSLPERVQAVEQLLGDSVNKHAQELQALRLSHDKHSKDLDAVKAASLQRGPLHDRLDAAERLLSDTTDRHSRELQSIKASHAKHDAAHSKYTRDLESLKEAMTMGHATLDQRLGSTEQIMGDNSGKHAREVQALRAMLEKHSKELSGFAHQASLPERLEQLEKQLGGSTDAHARELKALKDSHSKHAAAHSWLAQELEAMRASQEQHYGVAERVGYLEKLLGDSVERHAQEVQALREAHAKHATAQGRHGKDLESLKASELKHSTLEERLEYLERLLGDSAEAHTKELHSLKEAHGKHATTQGRLAQELEALKATHGEHSSLADRVGFLERTLNDSADQHAGELSALRAAHGKHAADLLKLAKENAGTAVQHTTLQQRVDYLEKVTGDSADRHTEEFRSLQDSHARFVEEVAGLKAQSAHHASLPERLSYLEKRLGDSADRHAKELQALKEAHDRHVQDFADSNEKHCTVEERLGYLERLLGESADRHAKELKALRDVHAKHAKELQDVKESHAHHASLPERIEYLERAVGESADEYFKEVQMLKAAHNKHDIAHGKYAKELEALKSAHAHHATIEERVGFLESLVNDSADNHSRDLAEAHRRMEALHTRLEGERAARDKQHGALRELLGQEQGERGAHRASVQDRIESLESTLSSGLDKHAKDISTTKDAHAQLLTETRAHAMRQGTLVERVERLERTVVDASSRCEKELKATNASVDTVTRRLNMIKEVWSEDTPRVPAKGF